MRHEMCSNLCIHFNRLFSQSVVSRPYQTEHVPRYDPKNMTRITDITDLVDVIVDDDSDDDSENGDSMAMAKHAARSKSVDLECGTNKGEGGGGGGSWRSSLWYRQAIIIIALIGIVAGASLAIGFTVVHSNPRKYQIVEGGEGEEPSIKRPEQNQQLLEMAERVIMACSESQLAENKSECQQLCHANICCFESGGKYSCQDDVSKDCAVYAGCEALVGGYIVEQGGEEDEE